MSKWRYSMLLFVCFIASRGAATSVAGEVYLEQFYNQAVLNIRAQDQAALTLQLNTLKECTSDCERLRSVFIAAFEDYLDVSERRDFLASFWSTAGFETFQPNELIRIQAIVYQITKIYNFGPIDAFNKIERSDEEEKIFLQTLCAYKNSLPAEYSISCETPVVRLPSRKSIKDLYAKLPDIHKYADGSYDGTFRLFMFCRQDRHYPCLMVLKDGNNKPVYSRRRNLWSQPALSLSSRGLPYNQTNGQTPQGIYQIDGVMPAADQQVSFGKFRRLIVNFIPKSPNEEDFRYLLPDSNLSEQWWTQSVEARNIGRGLFRIHGTGKINETPNSSYFPFIPTSGCIAKRENTYNGVEYKDQRILLDTLMKILNLTPSFENEVQIKGLLYLIDINNKKAPVALSDLKEFGI